MPTPPEQQLTPDGGWRLLPAPRLSLAGDGPFRRVVLLLIETFGRLDAANLWRLLLNNLRLMRGFLGFASKLMPFGELDRRDTELAILRVGWNCRARYEWGQHVDIGLRAGLTEAEIACVPEGPEASVWSPRQRAILRACDELHHERMVSDATWQLLSAEFNERLLLELLMLIGWYEGLAGVLNSTGLPLDAALERKLAAVDIHRRIGRR